MFRVKIRHSENLSNHFEEVIMKENFRFLKLVVWGSILLLMLVMTGCSHPTEPDVTKPVSGSQETADDGTGGEEEQDPGADQEAADDETGGEGEQDPGADQEAADDETGGGNEADPPPVLLGELRIQIGEIETPKEGVSPDMGGVTRYLLEFSGEDGRTAESLYIEAGEELTLTLEAGEWEIRAYGLLEKGAGQPPVTVIGGTSRAVVPENETETIRIIPGSSAAQSGEPGFLSLNIDYPDEKVWGAALTASFKADEDNFIPYQLFDLTGAKNQKISLPPGTYRIEYSFLSHNITAGSTEIVHIYPAMETGSSRVDISGAVFPDPPEFLSVNGLKEYLNSLPENAAANPYPVKITGVDVSSKEKSGETLKTLYEALNRRYVTLDLRGATGTELIAASTANIPERALIVSMILPESVIEINANGFSGYTSLQSVVMPGVETLNTSAFKNCGQLAVVFAPKMETAADAKDNTTGAFAGCGALKALYCPGLKTLGKYAMYGCTGLTEAVFPELLTVGGLAFKKCTALEALSLPSVAGIGGNSFEEDTALMYLIFGLNPPELEANIFRNTNFSQTGVIFVPPDAADVYKDTGLPNWPDLKGLIKSKPDTVAL
jgi:hypothetical protein